MTVAAQRNNLVTGILWLAGVGAICLRAPSLLIEPRFWAEEGSIYYAYAFAHPWYDTLIAHHGPYFLFFTNLASLAARAAPVPYAPMVTTLAALLVQSIPLAIILWGCSALWPTRLRQVVAVLIVIFVPISGEIWLTSTNSHFYFSLITLLILVDDGLSRAWYGITAYRVLLLVAGLTGVVSCFLTPLFVFKAWGTRQREHFVHAALLIACTLVQLSVLWSMRNAPGLAQRFAPVDVPTLASIVWTNTLVWPLFGVRALQASVKVLFAARRFGGWEFVVIGWALLLMAVFLFWYLAAGIERRQRWMLVGTYVLLTVLSIVSAAGSIPDKGAFIEPGFGGRYFYVPTVVLLLLILSGIQPQSSGRRMYRSAVCATLLTVALVLGILQYKPPPVHGPNWRIEVQRWQNDPTYQLQIWPRGWSVALPPSNDG